MIPGGSPGRDVALGEWPAESWSLMRHLQGCRKLRQLLDHDAAESVENALALAGEQGQPKLDWCGSISPIVRGGGQYRFDVDAW